MTTAIQNALVGALVADAASMGLHWLYDQDQIAKVANTGSLLFRHPEAAIYKDTKGYFAHAAKRAGELSHYGESTRIVGQLAADKAYETSLHRQHFYAAFGPCGSYVGYADRPTKTLIAHIINQGEKIQNPSGMDDNQMPALCVIPGLFSHNYDESVALDAASVISVNDDVRDGVRVVYACLTQLQKGADLPEALTHSAAILTSELGDKLREALSVKPNQPLETAAHFGLACQVKQALPVVWYLLRNAVDFDTLVTDNIRCGGDCCGRAVVAGAIAGYVFGVPEPMISHMSHGRIPINRAG